MTLRRAPWTWNSFEIRTRFLPRSHPCVKTRRKSSKGGTTGATGGSREHLDVSASYVRHSAHELLPRRDAIASDRIVRIAPAFSPSLLTLRQRITSRQGDLGYRNTRIHKTVLRPRVRHVSRCCRTDTCGNERDASFSSSFVRPRLPPLASSLRARGASVCPGDGHGGEVELRGDTPKSL